MLRASSVVVLDQRLTSASSIDGPRPRIYTLADVTPTFYSGGASGRLAVPRERQLDLKAELGHSAGQVRLAASRQLQRSLIARQPTALLRACQKMRKIRSESWERDLSSRPSATPCTARTLQTDFRRSQKLAEDRNVCDCIRVWH